MWNRFKCNKTTIALVYFSIACLLFLPTMKAGFATDFLGWANEYTEQGWRGIFSAFDGNNLTHFHHAVNYFLFVLFGNHALLWAMVYIVIHVCISLLWLDIGIAIGEKFQVPNITFLAISGSLLFLISPYQFEVLTWKVCLHYLLVHLCCVLIFKIGISSSGKPNKWALIKIGGLFLTALFSLELSFALPFMVLVFLLFVKDWKQERTFIISTSSLLFVLLVFYLILNKWTLGDWVGHYGAATHLNFEIDSILIHSLDYFFQYLLLLDYWPLDIRLEMYQCIEEQYILLSLSLSILLFVCVWLRKSLVILYALLFGFALLPILNLFFYTTTPIVNDRYGYLASAPFYFGLSTLILWLAKDFGKYILMGIIAIHLYFSIQNTVNGFQAGKVIFSLVQSIEAYKDKKEVVILTVPDNYKGYHIFREIGAPEGLSLRESFEWIYNKPFHANLISPAQFNMQNLSDRFKVQKTDSLSYSIIVGQSGTWFWRNGIGASIESHKNFDTQFYNGYYHIQLSEALNDAPVIVTEGLRFVEVEK